MQRMRKDYLRTAGATALWHNIGCSKLIFALLTIQPYNLQSLLA